MRALLSFYIDLAHAHCIKRYLVAFGVTPAQQDASTIIGVSGKNAF